MERKIKVFVSSIIKGMESCRHEIIKRIESIGCEPVAMGSWNSESENALSVCANKLAPCDVYVGIMTSVYGSIVKGENISATETEYNQAVESGKPCFIWVASEQFERETPLPKQNRRKREMQEKFIKKIGDRFSYSKFNSSKELSNKIADAILARQQAIVEREKLSKKSKIPVIYCDGNDFHSVKYFTQFFDYAFSLENDLIPECGMTQHIVNLMLNRSNRAPIYIMGDKGVGKTSVMKELEGICKREGRSACYLNLRKFFLQGMTWEQIKDRYRNVDLEDAVLLIDGLYDEWPVSEEMRCLQHKALSFIQQKSNVVISVKDKDRKLSHQGLIVKLGRVDCTNRDVFIEYVRRYCKIFVDDESVMSEALVELVEQYGILEVDFATLNFLRYTVLLHQKLSFSAAMLSYLDYKYNSYQSSNNISFDEAIRCAERYAICARSDNRQPFDEIDYKCFLRIGGGTLARRFLLAMYVCDNIKNGECGKDVSAWPILLENENHIIKVVANESREVAIQIVGSSHSKRGLIGLDEQLRRKILCKNCFSKKEISGFLKIRAELIYLMGRMSVEGRDKAQLIAYIGKVKKEDFSGKYYRRNQKWEVQFLKRTASISLQKLDSSKTEYLYELLSNKIQDSLNRGFHLEYYRDQTLDSKFEHQDRLGEWARTASHLINNINKALSSKNDDRISQIWIDIQTLVSLALHRHRKQLLQKLDRERVIKVIQRSRQYVDEVFGKYLDASFILLSLDAIPFGLELLVLYRLKQETRKGWSYRIACSTPTLRIESVAEHLYGCLVLCEMYLPSNEDVNRNDPNHEDNWKHYDKNAISKVLLIHDWAESILGDKRTPEKTCEDREREDIMQNVLCTFGVFDDVVISRDLYQAWRSSEDKVSDINGKLVRDIDCLDLLIQLTSQYKNYMEIGGLEELKENVEDCIQTMYVKRLWRRLLETIKLPNIDELIQALVAAQLSAARVASK